MFNFLAMPVFAQSNIQQAKQFVIKGDKYHKQNQHTLAIEEYSKAIRLDPKNAEAWWSRGQCYSEIEKPTLGLKDCKWAVKISSKNASAWIFLGNAYTNIKENDLAIDAYTEAIDLIKRNQISKYLSDTYARRGILYRFKNQQEKAISDFTESIKLDTKDWSAYNSRGLCYIELGRNRDAVNDFSSAIKINNQESVVYSNRGLANSKLGYNDECRKDCDRAIQLNPKNASAYNNRSFSWQDKLQKLEDLTKAISIDSSVPLFFKNRATIYQQLGEYASANADIKTAMILESRIK
jgi:tetratricopeptide (TPR) repeat protein